MSDKFHYSKRIFKAADDAIVFFKTYERRQAMIRALKHNGLNITFNNMSNLGKELHNGYRHRYRQGQVQLELGI